MILYIGLITGDNHTACEVCTCDNLDKPITVHCDSKHLSSLVNISFSSTIETISFMNNLLTFKTGNLKLKEFFKVLFYSHL